MYISLDITLYTHNTILFTILFYSFMRYDNNFTAFGRQIPYSGGVHCVKPAGILIIDNVTRYLVGVAV